MVEREPTDADQRAEIVERLDHTLFVEAGAGTGKTSALVDRIVALVDAGVSLREIAAITFTEAAAAELRDRVRAALDARLDETADSAAVTRYADAIDELDAAAVSTLHAFAQRLLSEHPVEVGLPPSVDVHDEVTSQLEFEERWEIFLDRIYGDPDLEETVLRKMASGVRDDALKVVARDFNENWDRLRGHVSVAADPAPVDLSELLDECSAVEADCALAAADDKLVLFMAERLRPCVDTLVALGDLERIQHLEFSFPKPGKRGAQGNWPDGYDLDGLRDRIRALDDRRADLLAEVRDQVLRRLSVDLAAFTLEAADERRGRGLLEFHDLLVLARDLLRGSASARRALHDRYTHLLLDEFQDTDPIQIELAVLIAARDPEPSTDDSWADIEVEHGSLFFVGDPKQSIYRFRRADIALFLAARQRFASAGALSLVENFRTVPGIVEFVNHLFAALMGGGVEGSQPRYDPLHAFRPPIGEEPPVRLIGGPRERALAAELRRDEAAGVAGTVVRALTEGWPVEGPDGSIGPARPSDIAILLPARTSLPVLEEELQRLDVPYRTETGSLVWNTQEVRDLLDVVRSVDDPTDAISVVAALRSPAFGCADDDLFEYHQAAGTWDYRVDTAVGYPEHPVVEAMAWLRELHDRRWWMDPAQVVETVARQRRLFEFGVLERRPRDVWRRLRFVIDRARAYTEAEGGTLRQFLQWAELQASDVARPAERVLPDPDDEAVRILTIHGSKGREFPIAILSGLTTRPGYPSRRPQVLWPPGRPPEISLSRQVTTNQFAPEREAEEQMDEHEKLRLLYVAATRARDHLVVSTFHQAGDDSFASRVWTQAQEVPALWRIVTAGPDVAVAPAVPGGAVPVALPAGERQEWIDTRRRVLDGQRARRVVSATSIARDVDGLPDPTEHDQRADDGADMVDSADAAGRAIRPASRGRGGTAIGRAVHAVLQLVDLATGDGLDDLAAAQAAIENVPRLADEIAGRVRAALASPIVAEAAGGADHWRELFLAVPVSGDTERSVPPDLDPPLVVEGYIDLLVATDAGLVVVDYKTDGVTGDAEIDEAVHRYRLQGAAYALAVEQLLGRPVIDCQFLFLGPDRSVCRSIADLPEAVAEVRRRVVGAFPGAAPTAP